MRPGQLNLKLMMAPIPIGEIFGRKTLTLLLRKQTSRSCNMPASANPRYRNPSAGLCGPLPHLSLGRFPRYERFANAGDSISTLPVRWSIGRGGRLMYSPGDCASFWLCRAIEPKTGVAIAHEGRIQTSTESSVLRLSAANPFYPTRLISGSRVVTSSGCKRRNVSVTWQFQHTGRCV